MKVGCCWAVAQRDFSLNLGGNPFVSPPNNSLSPCPSTPIYRNDITPPDEEVFIILFNKYNLLPQECLFIDDTRANIQAAELLGFKTIHFEDDTKLPDELANHGITFYAE